MYNSWHIALRYLLYRWKAKGRKGYGIHSPFVFDLVTKVLNDDRFFYAYESIEEQRRLLLSDEKNLEVLDWGAGGKQARTALRPIAKVAARSLKSPKYARLLFRLVQYFQSRQVLELGTCLGITASYLAASSDEVQVTTLEGAPAYVKKARRIFENLRIKNIRVVEGNFDDTLLGVLKESRTWDFVFIDGNHRLEPTLRYFEQILPHAHAGTLFVFDDIHWSREMEEAWQKIQQHPSVTLTIDLFFVGLVFIRPEQIAKEHFIIPF
jgi:predicted O-methyltransferase YrrM